MANEKNDAQQEQLSSDASKKNNNSKSGGGALIVLLCIVLIAAGTGLIYKDVSRTEINLSSSSISLYDIILSLSANAMRTARISSIMVTRS